MDVNNPHKMVCIGIDPYPYGYNFGIMEYVHGILYQELRVPYHRYEKQMEKTANMIYTC